MFRQGQAEARQRHFSDHLAMLIRLQRDKLTNLSE
jgi:hypothetical protein